MNITKEQKDGLNAVINIVLEPVDYKEKYEKKLSEYRRNAQMPGFRKGNVPKGMIKKMYGKQLLLEEVNNLLSESLDKYIKENNVEILGRPILNETSEVKWEEDETFNFNFELGLRPEIKIDYKKLKGLSKYKIKMSDEETTKMVEDLQARYGNEVYPAKSEENDSLEGNFVELDKDNNELEGGLKKEKALFLINKLTKKEKKKYIGISKDEEIILNPKDVFENETDAAIMLGVSKEDYANNSSNFKFKVTNILRKDLAILDQSFFDKILGENAVKSQEEFVAKIKENSEKEYLRYCEQKFQYDVLGKLIESVEVELPAEFLKKLILSENKEIKEENIDQYFEAQAKYLKTDLIKDKIAVENKINIDAQELRDYVKKYIIKEMFRMSEEEAEKDEFKGFIDKMVDNFYDKQTKQVDSLSELLFTEKVIDSIIPEVKYDEKEIGWEEFIKLGEK